MVKILAGLGMIFSLLIAPTLLHCAEIKVSTDRTQVVVNESFQLTFETSEDVDGEPDFSPLKRDFEILGQKQSSSYRYINGSGQRSKSWILTVMAKQSGRVAVPAIKFGSSSSRAAAIVIGKERAVNKSAKKADSGLFLTLETDTTTPYIQAQVVMTFKIFRSIAINSASMTSPTFTGGDVIVEKLGEGRQYNTQKNGRTHVVEEHRYIFFPQKSGKLTVNPIQLTAQIGERNQAFGNLFSDPFGRNKSSIKRVRSNPITLQVKPIPDSFHGKRWLPAHEMILTGKWSQNPPKFMVGEPITRTLTLMSDGIPAKQLPKLSNQKINGLKQYADQPEATDQVELSGIVGILQQKNAIIPTAEGSHTLPAIKIPWWDVDEDRLKTAQLPEVTFSAAPADQTIAPTPQHIPPSLPTIALDTAPKTITLHSEKPLYSQPLFWLTLLFGSGWLITALAWWFSNKGLQAKSADSEHKIEPTNLKKILKELKSNCQGNIPGESRRLLLQWGAEQWPELKSPGVAEIRSKVLPPLQDELDNLEKTLFAKEPSPWRGELLWQGVEQQLKSGKKRATRDDKGQLSPLY
jgi:hypothetical protein